MKTLFTLIGVLLLGYAFLDKGFAYVGVAPLFISEVVLAVSLVILVMTIGVTAVPVTPATFWLVAFMTWGAACTLPHLGAYGLDALRDAVVWGYALFALIVAAAFTRSGVYEAALNRYSGVLLWFLFWCPVGIAVYVVMKDSLPTFGNTDTTIFHLKAGDLGVHLAGATAFMLLGLHRLMARTGTEPSVARERLMWLAAILAVGMVGALNRGGFVSVIIAAAVIVLARPTSRVARLGMVAALLLLAVLFTVDVGHLSGDERQVSLAQVILNLQSVLGIVDSQSLEGTVEWRLAWWERIIDYTVFGPYFWFGKGFGVNLFRDDLVNIWILDDPLRSPHNGHITILARAGVPGLALWVAFNAAYVWGLARAFFA
ncbi:MAG: O-antigen ligase family protein, partial [Reyranellaceae bacterium]